MNDSTMDGMTLGAVERHPAREQTETPDSSGFIHITPWDGDSDGFDEANVASLDMGEGSMSPAVQHHPFTRRSSLAGGALTKTYASQRRFSGAPFANIADLIVPLDPIPDASHTRDRTVSPPNSKCFAGTRKPVLKKIRSWVDSSVLLSNPHIMWVYGYAGCGKSAIAQDIAEYFAGQKRLAASFFFFRGSGDRNKTSRFARTIASQVAVNVSAAAPIIGSVLDAKPGLLEAKVTSLSAQFRHLVLEPINKIKWNGLAASLRHGPFLVVLDGLDECEDKAEIAALIEDMVEYFSKNPRTPLRFLICSRVDSHIHERLYLSNQVTLLDLVKQTSDKDISTALDIVISDQKLSWLSRDDKDRLTTHIGGSFIFMTTVIKSLFEPGIDGGLAPVARLAEVLAMRPDFDSLYTSILMQAQDIPHFLDVVSTITLARLALPIAHIAELVGIGTADVVEVLASLHSIVQVPDDDRTPVTLWHTSLRDFLSSPDRAGPFLASHRPLASGCAILLANAHHEPPPMALKYCQHFAVEHWRKFLAVEGDTDTFTTELDRICRHSERVFTNELVAEFHTHLIEMIMGADNWKGLIILRNAGVNLAMPLSDGSTALEVVTLSRKLEGFHVLLQANYGVLDQPFRGAHDILEHPSAANIDLLTPVTQM
ncbi:hypothetical protein FA13DRAFT_1107648 [Coprinellus micaceus]|uniref:Nephrocystin 3-like N-terminal domain-containing protein n=1 Tax=Coprinellus micaceus TaxID=71717 RepID=A0A4Y7RL46_COPMI|nr:hypothetical protein FA13DRAFT_1107648 [Coprinellus micaceus]